MNYIGNFMFELGKIWRYAFIVFSLLAFFYLCTLNVELSQQAVIGIILTLLVIGLISSPLSKYIETRLIIFFIGGFLGTRYIYWRTTNTIIFTDIYDFIPMLLLYFAEIYSYIIFIGGLFVNVLPLDRDKKQIIPRKFPSVDVLIPTFNEPLEIVKITAIGAKLINYPRDKINIFLLDDGATDARLNSEDYETRIKAAQRKKEFKKFCLENGINYLTRRDNKNAKSGNINAALPHCTGDLILILDCDHIPTRDILMKTVGFFEKDEKLFLVQTPHFMINANPVEKNLRLFADAPPEYEMFYGVIQKGLDFWNSSFFCGSAALLSRKYLMEVGGISGQTITEDAETSLELHSRGLRSVYYSVPLTSGLSPETFRDFINQRIRWAQGMMQLILLKNPLFKAGLKLYQKICYTNSSIFWMFGIARMVFIIAPFLYLFFGLRIYMASVPQVLAFALPFLISSFYISNYLFGKYRWPLFSELYETAQSIFLLPAILAVLLNPRKPKFKVTPKGQSLTKDFLSPLGWPFFIIFLACILSIPFVYYRWIHYPLDRDVIIICTSWMIFHIILSIMCLGAVYERHQLRRHPRTWATGKIKVLRKGHNDIVEGEIIDLSLGGIGAKFPKSFKLDKNEKVIVYLKDNYGNDYSFWAKSIRISEAKNHTKVAFQFLPETDQDFENLVAYVYGDSMRWILYQQRIIKSVPTLVGISYLIKQGITAFKEASIEFFKLCHSFLKEKIGYTNKLMSNNLQKEFLQ